MLYDSGLVSTATDVDVYLIFPFFNCKKKIFELDTIHEFSFDLQQAVLEMSEEIPRYRRTWTPDLWNQCDVFDLT